MNTQSPWWKMWSACYKFSNKVSNHYLLRRTLTIDNDLQTPQGSSGIANEATPNKEPSKKVIDNRETLLLAMFGSLLIVGFLGFMLNQSVA